MPKVFRVSSLAFAAALFATSVAAGNYTFNIKNESQYIISSFQTNEGNGWSANWLNGDVNSGQVAKMRFNADGPCDIDVRVGWRTTDGGQEIGDAWSINICKAHTVYFDGDQVTFD